MSPTLLRQGGFRFLFFSREEARMHVHVQSGNGEAKFWLEPAIDLATSVGLNQSEINAARAIIKEHADEFRDAWHRHFLS